MFYLFIFLLAIFSDQLSKFLIDQNLLPGESISLWEGIIELSYVRNTGAAFGILAERRVLLLVIQIAVLIFIYVLYQFYLPKIEYNRLFIVLLAAGAIGNIIDRIRLGYVIDFIDLQIWPVFNLADIFIVVGTLGIVYNLWQSI